MSVTPNTDHHVAKVIDANLDRAREGLRVIEDWCRFGLVRKDLVITLKDFRHQLGKQHKESYKRTRSTKEDPATQLSHPSQNNRANPLDIVFANCARAQEALRVIEEFSRESNQELAMVSAEIRYGVYEIEKEILKSSDKNRRLVILEATKLCLITDTHTNLLNIVSSALKEGVKMIQYRSKEENDLTKLSQAKELAAICKKYNSLLIINDRIDIALAVNADGVHLGQEDFSFNDAKRLLGDEKILGISTHSLDQAQKAQQEGWDYIGLGPIFNSKSKPHITPLGLKILKQVSSTIQLPVFAIGGIDDLNSSKVIEHGSQRIAVINAIINSNDAATASRKLLNCLK